MNRIVLQNIVYVLVIMLVLFGGCLTIFAIKLNNKADIVYVNNQDDIIVKVVQTENKITRDSISEGNKLLREIANVKAGTGN